MSTPEQSRPERPTQRPEDGQTQRSARRPGRSRRRKPETRLHQGGQPQDGQPPAERRERGTRRPRQRSAEELQRRRESVPKITYPEELPVSQRRDEILATIRDHQVVIVAGETGSGKT